MPKRQKYSNGGGPRNVSSVFRLEGNNRGAKIRVQRDGTTVEVERSKRGDTSVNFKAPINKATSAKVSYGRPKGGGGYSRGSVGIKHIQGKNIFGFDVFGNTGGGGKGAQITWKREL
jgi:hypothetical protein